MAYSCQTKLLGKMKRLKIPNYLLLLRFILTPIIVGLILFGNLKCFSSRIIVIFLTVIAFLTDFLDGFLARRYQWETTFGKVFDPIADKLLFLTIIFSLLIKWEDIFFSEPELKKKIFKNFLYSLFCIISFLTLLREFIVSAMRLYLTKKFPNNFLQSNIFGKGKTLFQFIAILYFFLFSFFISRTGIYKSYNNLLFLLPFYITFLLSFLFSLISFLNYFFYCYSHLKKTHS